MVGKIVEVKLQAFPGFLRLEWGIPVENRKLAWPKNMMEIRLYCNPFPVFGNPRLVGTDLDSRQVTNAQSITIPIFTQLIFERAKTRSSFQPGAIIADPDGKYFPIKFFDLKTRHIDGAVCYIGVDWPIQEEAVLSHLQCQVKFGYEENNQFTLVHLYHKQIEGALTERQTYLEDQLKESRARCMERWWTVGLTPEEAEVFTNDSTLGAPWPALYPNETNPVKVIVAGLGAGKSLLADRIFQDAVSKALQSLSDPLPIFLEGNQIEGNLQEAIQYRARVDAERLKVDGTFVVIDDLDAAGIERAVEILKQARRIVNYYNNCKIILTSNPFTALLLLIDDSEKVSIPPLLESQVNTLIRRIIGFEYPMDISRYSWPQSIKNAVQFPLFAVLLGAYLRKNLGMPFSVGDLLNNLVNNAFGRYKLERKNLEQLMEKLAVLCINWESTSIPTGELTGSSEDIEKLRNSRLVVERSGKIGFALAILSDWFAAQSVITRSTKIQEFSSDESLLERWNGPFVTLLADKSIGHHSISEFLKPIVISSPGIASQLVEKGIISARAFNEEGLAFPPEKECQDRLCEAMSCWVSGLGPLAQLVAPVKVDGTLLDLKVKKTPEYLVYHWEHQRDVPIYDYRTEVTYSHSRPAHPAWAWKWMFDELVHNLSKLLNERVVLLSDELTQETVWKRTLSFIGQKTSLQKVPVDLIESRVEEFKRHFPASSVTGDEDAGTIRVMIENEKYSLAEFISLVKSLRQQGKSALEDPWPGVDREYSIYEPFYYTHYSPERLLDRVRAVYYKALNVYEEVTRNWFPKIGTRLWMSNALPARLKGVLIWRGHMDPELSWYLEPLPNSSTNDTDISIGLKRIDREEFIELGYEKLKQLRPEQAPWIGASHRNGSVYDVFKANPVTQLVYRWLWEDLARVDWVNGIFRSE